jgi:DNA primase
MPIRSVTALKRKTSSVKQAVRPVNQVIPLEVLPEDHIAVQYLKDRGFTREYLANYHLGYCADQNDWMAYDRLIIPIISRGKCVGWQARAIRDSDKGPKYYTSPNVTLGNYLYNFDVARQCPYVVLTEGVADSWRVGPAGVCLFGKSLSAGQQKLLLNNWIGKPICVMLDRDAEKESKKITEKLLSKHRGPVIFVPVPEGYKDPGDVPHEDLTQHIRSYLGG